MVMATISRRHAISLLEGSLKQQRASFEAHWDDLSRYISPRRSRFFTADVNRGDKRMNKILDSTGSLALRTLAAGMVTHVTSPAKPWFRLTVANTRLSEVPSVKFWLHEVSERMARRMSQSNLYTSMPTFYQDLGGFATAAIFIDEDFQRTFHTWVLPIGSYWVGSDRKGKVNTFYHEFRMTVRQLVEEFARPSTSGEPEMSNLSSHVREMWKGKQFEAWVDVCHVIMPNEDWDPEALDAKYKRFKSCYYERGNSQLGGYDGGVKEDLFLRESGYDYFPVLVGRWGLTGEDDYGTDCPGMMALGDIRQLQTMEKRAAVAIHKKVDPPMKMPPSLQGKASMLPGEATWTDDPEKVQELHRVDLNLADLENKTAQIRDRIRRTFFEDLFLMLSLSDRRQFTATEIMERREEKLLALGPVLERLNQDVLDELIEIVFALMLKQGDIPEPPEELQGAELKVEYISVMHQAFKMAGVTALDRFISILVQLAQVAPEAIDNLNLDKYIREYGEATGVPPTILRTPDAVEAIRQARAQAQQAQAAAEATQQATMSAKNLSQANLEGNNALAALLARVQRGELSRAA